MKYILLFICFLAFIKAQQNLDYEKRILHLEELLEKQSQRIEELEKKVEENTVSKWENLKKETQQTQQKDTKKQQEYTQQIVLQYLEQIESLNEMQMGYDEGFFLKSYDSNFELRFNGAFQAGLGIFENDTTDNNGIFFNAIYLSFEITLFNQWLAKIEFDLNGFRDNGDGLFNNPEFFEPRLKDAYLQYTSIPEFQIRLGQMHIPFTIEGQYKEYESLSIFTEPFIRSWGHGRDLGIMLLGTISDTLEYKAGIFNGEGENKANQSDDFLLAGQIRFFPLKKSQNPQTFLHVGVLRGRDNRLKNDGDFGSAALFTPWGRHIFGDNQNLNNGNLAQTQGWQTAADIGLKVIFANFWLESEFLFFEWERDLDSFGHLGRIWGMGASVALRYIMNFNGKNDGSGLFALSKFSYTDIDDYHNSNAINSSIDGQTAFTYTLGVGYAFNRHVWVQMNWIFLNVIRADVDPADEDEDDRQEDLENGLFLQMTTVW